ncbi:hypothetical protein A2627_00075 [Candidatus Woesebacteria bacterium RIFCSPHIGHO2_01_FULL_39_28]|uniref:Uncharacterized protein n=1 Tax=Candidatus Woesebacteria bacterium RIFCSPHIGHO2_01_FULL_39_28 TaxID=1802496 RepID=A0A1F7YCY8_9BACT|nr:MAG: hypothetical protein A2627_00075 [Candidatus Woesebacteria bacterium RIFCSPHIGHO2_01_FULL_39_28]
MYLTQIVVQQAVDILVVFVVLVAIVVRPVLVALLAVTSRIIAPEVLGAVPGIRKILLDALYLEGQRRLQEDQHRQRGRRRLAPLSVVMITVSRPNLSAISFLTKT